MEVIASLSPMKNLFIILSDSRKNLVCVLSNFILHTAKYRMLNFIKHLTTVKVSE